MIKQTIHVALAFAAFSLWADYKPEAWNLEARQRFAEQGFGIFTH